MENIAVNIVRFNHPASLLRDCIQSVLAQELQDFSVTLTENGSSDSIEAEMLALFGSDPKFRYVDNKQNLGFAGAHNRFILQTAANMVLPLNPDTVMSPGFLNSLARAFEDPSIGAATGKMVRFQAATEGDRVLDGTGIIVSRGRRGRERGQLLIDTGQFDNSPRVFGVSGTASLYRKSALDEVRLGDHEYYDEDFFAYWEDLDLSWRLRLAGYECAFVPQALIYHARAAGQSSGGYRRPVKFIRHHRQLPISILRRNWTNQLFCIIKNDFGWSFWRDSPFIIARQVLMLCYIAVFEPRTLGAISNLCRLLPKMLQKRKIIQAQRVVRSSDIGQWFKNK